MKGKRASRQIETRLAVPIYLNEALQDLTIPIRAAEYWIRPADLVQFLDDVEKQVRALKALIDRHIEHSKVLRPGGDPELELVLEIELAGAQKSLNRIAALRSPKTDFSAELEELRMLRSGELTIHKEPRP